MLLLSAEGAPGCSEAEPQGIGPTMRTSSEGAPESTLEMESGSTHLPLLQSVVDFCLFPGVPLASPQADILLTLRVSIRIIFAPFGLVRLT